MQGLFFACFYIVVVLFVLCFFFAHFFEVQKTWQAKYILIILFILYLVLADVEIQILGKNSHNIKLFLIS